jgi:hypothetical protein
MHAEFTQNTVPRLESHHENSESEGIPMLDQN